MVYSETAAANYEKAGLKNGFTACRHAPLPQARRNGRDRQRGGLHARPGASYTSGHNFVADGAALLSSSWNRPTERDPLVAFPPAAAAAAAARSPRRRGLPRQRYPIFVGHGGVTRSTAACAGRR